MSSYKSTPNGWTPHWRWAWVTELCKTDLHKLPNDEKSAKVRQDALTSLSKDKKFTTGVLAEELPMSKWEEFVSCCILLVFPGSMFIVPFVCLYYLYVSAIYYSWFWFAVTWGAILAVSFQPHPVAMPDVIHSYASQLLLKYFSFKIVWGKFLKHDDQHVFGAPPHGVFPIGNILTMLSIKHGAGFYFNGLAADAAMHLPVLKHCLGAIGAVRASRHIADKTLKAGNSIGISVGGVAEIFETNDADEAVFIKKRFGFIKLALRHGCTVMPCFLFGNTKTLDTFYDPWGIARALSRKLGFGTIILWGRGYLPIMKRVPIVGVLGAPVKCPKIENPTREQIQEYHSYFVEGVREIFDTHKDAYGWGHKKLIVK